MNPSLMRRDMIDGFAERYHQACFAGASEAHPRENWDPSRGQSSPANASQLSTIAFKKARRIASYPRSFGSSMLS